MNEVTKTIRRALKYGFDLSGLPNYTEKKFKSDLFDFLVRQKYYVTEESGIIMVGLDILDDTVEILIVNSTMKVKPLTDEGFFIIFVDLLKFISISANKLKVSVGSDDDDDISTESLSEDEESEELWL